MKLTPKTVLALVLGVSCVLASWLLYPRFREYRENKRFKAQLSTAREKSATLRFNLAELEKRKERRKQQLLHRDSTALPSGVISL
jgi:hypothetical protein